MPKLNLPAKVTRKKAKAVTLTKALCIIFLLVFSINALVAIPAQAQLTNTAQQDLENQLTNTAQSTYDTSNADLIPMIGNIIKIALGFLGIILLIIIIYGGFLWMTSQGEEEKVGKAKKIIGAGVVGVLIIVLAYTITYFVVNQLTAGIATGTLPQ